MLYLEVKQNSVPELNISKGSKLDEELKFELKEVELKSIEIQRNSHFQVCKA